MATKKTTTKKAVRTAKKLHRTNPKLFYAIVAVIVIAAIAVGVLYAVRPDLFKPKMPTTEGKLIVHFIDVGQGDAIYIQFPSGKDMLIDAGSAKSTENPLAFVDGSIVTENQSNLVVDYIKKYSGDEKLDYVMITHSDSDHISYMDEVFKDFEISVAYLPFIDVDTFDTSATTEEKALFDGGMPIETEGYKNVTKLAFNEQNCTVKCVKGNFNIDIEKDVSFKVYSLDADEYEGINEPNELSPICLMSYAGRTVVLTGDAEDESETDYIDDTLPTDCDVLKVGHHGSESSTSQEFLDDINVEYAVISAGNHSTFNHPRQVTLDRLSDNDVNYYCTRYNGTVVLTISFTEGADKGEMSFACAKGAVA